MSGVGRRGPSSADSARAGMARRVHRPSSTRARPRWRNGPPNRQRRRTSSTTRSISRQGSPARTTRPSSSPRSTAGGRRPGASTRTPSSPPTPRDRRAGSRTSSPCRRPTSPAACTWATPSSSPCRTCLRGSTACAGGPSSGRRGPTTRESRRSSRLRRLCSPRGSGGGPTSRSRTRATRRRRSWLAGRSSWRRFGSTRRSRGEPSRVSSGVSARAPTGPGSGSRWTRLCP
mmetsp:Transcript_8158/g.19121  ORF Transcript_8158/g.19121 Transcript_8158/m.19121 type:complete len:231 (-) Transcript_8158:623-1315(-)